MVQRADLICVMDYRNEAEVVSRYPSAARKTILLGGVDGAPEGPSIPDPYMLDSHGIAAIYERLSGAVNALVNGLAAF
jgi:protein-tyrosine-phosphatase